MSNGNLSWSFKPSVTESFSLIAGSILVFWYSWILDDAYVYFRYVDNWVIHGQGLVWNPGEYVEGFSSPLWVLLLGTLRVIELDYWIIVRAVALLCFGIFWYLACIVNRGLMPVGRHTKSYNAPLTYLSFTYAVECYFSSGLESPLVSVAAVTYAAAILWPRSRALQGLIGLTPLVRHELVIPLLLFVAWSLFVKRARPITTLVVFVLSVGAYGLFRVWYYAELLPNPFYLKDTTWILHGLASVYDSLMPYFTIPYLAGMGLIFLSLQKHGPSNALRRDERLAMLTLALPVALYTIKIGGDARHFRHLVFPYILGVLATGGLVERLTTGISRGKKRYVPRFMILFGISISLCYPRQLQQHPIFHSHARFVHRPFLAINDAALHRLHSSGITPPWHAVTSILAYDRAKDRFEADSKSGEIVAYAAVPQNVAVCDRSPIPVIADAWCQTAYLHPAFPVIQSFGLTDPFLARIRMQSDRPAHKLGLLPLASDLLDIRCQYGFAPGAFDKAISKGQAPNWIRDNIDALRELERKVYNEHDFSTNLARALSPTVRIRP